MHARTLFRDYRPQFCATYYSYNLVVAIKANEVSIYITRKQCKKLALNRLQDFVWSLIEVAKYMCEHLYSIVRCMCMYIPNLGTGELPACPPNFRSRSKAASSRSRVANATFNWFVLVFPQITVLTLLFFTHLIVVP